MEGLGTLVFLTEMSTGVSQQGLKFIRDIPPLALLFHIIFPSPAAKTFEEVWVHVYTTVIGDPLTECLLSSWQGDLVLRKRLGPTQGAQVLVGSPSLPLGSSAPGAAGWAQPSH